MIVCLCHGVSDRALRKVIEEGADTLPAVAKSCGAGTDCGSCHNHIRQLIKEDKAERECWNLPVLQTG